MPEAGDADQGQGEIEARLEAGGFGEMEDLGVRREGGDAVGREQGGADRAVALADVDAGKLEVR